MVQRKPTNGHASMSSLESRQHLLLLQGGMPICSDRVKDELREQLSEIPRCSETSLITRFEFVQHVEALNHALRNIPAERVRMHVCWGNYEGPHHYDVPLADIVDIIFSGRPASISFEAANPRHAHEWALFETVKLPEGKIVIPGVIESKSNFIEHPELIANRISNYAKLVGRENVIAGSDCGYGTWVGQAAVDPDVVWAKFTALAEGARIATERFWK